LIQTQKLRHLEYYITYINKNGKVYKQEVH
jgi:hypothetical protein